MNEPTAAALAYGLQDRDGESQFLVFDLGGGTFDVTVLEHFDGVMEVRASSGDAQLGGEDFTHMMQTLLAERIGLDRKSQTPDILNQLRYFAEHAKRNLSKDQPFTTEFDLHGAHHEITITPEQFETAAQPLLRRLRAPMHRCLYDANGTPHKIDRVILVGGATRMPLAKQFAARETRLFPEADINPDHVVALGAAVQAALIKEDRAVGDVIMTDVSPFSVGIETSHGEGRQRIDGLFTPIVQRNTPLPTSRVERFHAGRRDQRVMNISIYQGESARVENNVHLGDLKVRIQRETYSEELPWVDIRITQDVSGLIEIIAKLGQSDVEKRMSIATGDVQLTDDEIAQRMQALDHLKLHPRDDEANIAVLNRLDRLFEMATGDDRDHLHSLLADFQIVLNKQDTQAIENARHQLIEILNAIDEFYVS